MGPYDGKLEMRGGTIKKNTASSYGGGIYNQQRYVPDLSKYLLALYGGTIVENNSYIGGGIYIAGSSAVIKDTDITGNRANYAGGIYFSRGQVVIQQGTALCNNNASVHSADFYGEKGTINISSAIGMQREYDNSGYLIDGWYVDYPATDRWSTTNSVEKYYSDTLNESFSQNDSNVLPLIAAYTPHGQIEVMKQWDDADNLMEKRPDMLEFTLVNANTRQPVKLLTYDDSEGWIPSALDAKITLTETEDWTGTIWPLAIDDYRDSNRFLLQEEETGNLYRLKDGDPIITFEGNSASGGTAVTNVGLFSAKFTNILEMPLMFALNWDDQDNADELRPNSIIIRLTDKDGKFLKQTNGEDAVFTLTARDGWRKSLLMAPFDVNTMKVVAEVVEDYTQLEPKVVINADGSISIEMTNQHIPEVTPTPSDTPTPSPTETPELTPDPGEKGGSEDIPDTGDKSNVGMWALLAVFSVVGIVFLITYRRNHRK